MILLFPPFCFLILLWLYMGHACCQLAIDAGKLSTFAKLAGFYPLTLAGFLWDVLINLTWFTLLFLDIPREWTLTERIERLKDKDGYRGKLANWLCRELNALLPGHCR